MSLAMRLCVSGLWLALTSSACVVHCRDRSFCRQTVRPDGASASARQELRAPRRYSFAEGLDRARQQGYCCIEPAFGVAQGALRLRGGGIAGFQRWFLSEFPEAVIKVYDGDVDTFDHVAFDMNGLLHSACLKAKTLEHAVLRIFRELDATLRILQPRKSVVLAFDGPGPLAKLLTQRKRRLKASRQSKYKMSGLNITPGTEFMLAVRRACEYFAADRVASSYRFKDAAFFISGSDVAGEGEVKIIEWLHLLRSKEPTDSLIIVGGDADLVLQGLATYSVRDMFVFAGRDKSQAIGKMSNAPSLVLSLWEVVRSLERQFPGESKVARVDILILMIMNGNDYLPKVRGSGFRSFFKAYSKVRRMTPIKGRRGDESWGFLDPPARCWNWRFLHTFMSLVHRDVPSLGPRLSEALKVPQLEREDEAAAYARRLAAPRMSDYVSVLMQIQQKTLKSSAPINYMSSQQDDLSWQCRLDWLGRTYAGSPCANIKAAKQSVAREVLLGVGAVVLDGDGGERLGDATRRLGIAAEFLDGKRAGPTEAEEEGAEEDADAAEDNKLEEEVEPAGPVGESETDGQSGDDRMSDLLAVAGGESESMSGEGEDEGEGSSSKSSSVEFDDQVLDEDQGRDDGEGSDEQSAGVGQIRAGKGMYDVESYLQGILWNVQMYIDGYVPDYYYTYKAKYAPDARAIQRWVEQEEFDPFPDMELPLSLLPALAPVEACLALIPKSGGCYLPAPYRVLLEGKGSALQALLNGAADDPLSATTISDIIDREVDLEVNPLTPAEQDTIRPGTCWKVYCRPTHRMLAPGFAAQTDKATREDMKDDGRSVDWWIRDLVQSQLLNGKTLPPPPLPPPSRFRPIAATKDGVACLLVKAQDFPPCFVWPSLEPNSDESSVGMDEDGDTLSSATSTSSREGPRVERGRATADEEDDQVADGLLQDDMRQPSSPTMQPDDVLASPFWKPFVRRRASDSRGGAGTGGRPGSPGWCGG